MTKLSVWARGAHLEKQKAWPRTHLWTISLWI